MYRSCIITHVLQLGFVSMYCNLGCEYLGTPWSLQRGTNTAALRACGWKACSCISCSGRPAIIAVMRAANATVKGLKAILEDMEASAIVEAQERLPLNTVGMTGSHAQH